MTPERPARFKEGPYTRVGQRGISLLLKAIPGHLKEEIVSCRKLTCIETLSIVLTTYQPGGLSERAALLKYLTNPDPGKNIKESLRGLRRWCRWKARAEELNIAIPDATLLVAGLDQLTSGTLAQFPEVSFRCSTFRHLNNIDHIPSDASVTSLSQFLQAELQLLDTGGGGKRIRLAKAQEGSDSGEGKGKDGKGKGTSKGGKGKTAGNSGKTKGCYHWMSSGGCRLGSDCHFKHDREVLNAAPDVGNRCFNCSGIGHRSTDCTAPNSQGSEGGNAQGGGSSKGKGGKSGSKGDSKGNIVKKVEEDKPTPTTATLINPAGQLLDQMQIKALRVR